MDSDDAIDEQGGMSEESSGSSSDVLLTAFLRKFCAVVTPEDFVAMDDLVSNESQSEDIVDRVDTDMADTLRKSNYVKNLLGQLDPTSKLQVAINTLSDFLEGLGLTKNVNDTSISFELDDSNAAKQDGASLHVGAPQHVVVSLVFTSKSAKRIYLYVGPRSEQGKKVLDGLSEKGKESGYFRNMKGLGHHGSGNLRIAVPVNEAAVSKTDDLPQKIRDILAAEVAAMERFES